MTSGPGRPTVRRGREEVRAVVAGGNPRDAAPGVGNGAGGQRRQVVDANAASVVDERAEADVA